MLHKWHDKLHLVSDKALADLDTHILDCAYLWPFIKDDPTIVDVGSGNGFPGAVLSIMGAKGILVDSHKKKVVFLNELVNDLNLELEVIPHSIRNLRSVRETWIIAKGFGPLEKCLSATSKLWRRNKKGLFIKSDSVQEEIDFALANGWKFDYNICKRYMQGTIVRIENVRS
ncbi:hypothetical protein FZC34_01120 [Candidatus Cytomitobacter primus]|uniref:Uncharacterized protein n=2 Tax=Candidatus Cytomitobacter primus TaxID=2066024 RepID=A0A5C0UEN0_9PROT|nr:hypothetical protein FZC34_01120 [Candidatus Cytomitobacter primus]